ncbi:MAG TPA: DUF167 domain-containing protein [Anaerolineales bacterium]|nr:DUF167 domain-containing protein [Anaerolineales bacterium]
MRKFKLHGGKGGSAITVRVTPRARRTEVAEVLEDGTIRIRVTAPPVEGKANAALIEFLADALKIRKSRVEIVAGVRGLDKIVSITDLSAGEVQRRLQDWIDRNESD